MPFPECAVPHAYAPLATNRINLCGEKEPRSWCGLFSLPSPIGQPSHVTQKPHSSWHTCNSGGEYELTTLYQWIRLMQNVDIAPKGMEDRNTVSKWCLFPWLLDPRNFCISYHSTWPNPAGHPTQGTMHISVEMHTPFLTSLNTLAWAFQCCPFKTDDTF